MKEHVNEFSSHSKTLIFNQNHHIKMEEQHNSICVHRKFIMWLINNENRAKFVHS
jgi:hypothetical protein